MDWFAPLYWRIGTNAHVLSLAAVCIVGTYAVLKFKVKGVLLPIAIVGVGETLFWVYMAVLHGIFGLPVVEIVILPVAAVLYWRYFRPPYAMLQMFVLIFAVNVLDGFRVSYGFLPNDPYYFDLYTNFKEIASWVGVSGAMVADMRVKGFAK